MGVSATGRGVGGTATVVLGAGAGDKEQLVRAAAAAPAWPLLCLAQLQARGGGASGGKEGSAGLAVMQLWEDRVDLGPLLPAPACLPARARAPDLRPEGLDSRSEGHGLRPEMSDLRPGGAGLRSGAPDLRPGGADLRPGGLDWVAGAQPDRQPLQGAEGPLKGLSGNITGVGGVGGGCEPAAPSLAIAAAACVTVGPGCQPWAVLGTASGQLLVWDLARGGVLAGLDCGGSGGVEPGAVCVAVAAAAGREREAGAVGRGGVVVAGVGDALVVWEPQLRDADAAHR